MSLEPVAGDPGHWRDPDWSGTTPGTFAVVIGVSRYPWFKGGDKRRLGAEMKWVREAQGLGQLYVSALTARRFFDWMNNGYALEQAPPVSCRLLLSPTDEELAADPSIGQHALEPTLAHCSAAIQRCKAELSNLPEEARAKSRLLFFFSGHGLQSTADQHVLLPCDYLTEENDAGIPSFNHALSTQNLLNGLKVLKVPCRYYFLDACRNDTAAIRELRPKGATILDEFPVTYFYPDIEIDALLYATMEGQRAWQPKRPDQGPTLFGRALLDGLAGTPNIRLTEADDKRLVEFFDLVSYTNTRIAELHEGFRSTAKQRILTGGAAGASVVTELPGGPPKQDADDVDFLMPIEDVSDLAHISDLSHSRELSAEWLEDVVEFEAAPMEDAGYEEYFEEYDGGGGEGAGDGDGDSYEEAPFAPEPPAPPSPAHFEYSETVPDALQAGAWRGDFGVAHGLFGHETTTDLFANRMRVAALNPMRWLDEHELRLLRVDRSEIPADEDAPAQTNYRIALGLTGFELAGYWLDLQGVLGKRVGVLLPGSRDTVQGGMAQFVVRVEVTHLEGPDHYGPQITALGAAPMATGDGPVAEATRLWLRYQGESAGAAVADFEGSRLEDLLRGKMQSPLAATIAGLVLLRAGRLDLIHDWLRNLASWFPDHSDGAVLWAEQVMRQRGDPAEAAREAARWLSQLAIHGLPMTGEALSYAATMMEQLALDTEILAEDIRANFWIAKSRVDEALSFFRPGGLFAGFANLDPEFEPAFRGFVDWKIDTAPIVMPVDPENWTRQDKPQDIDEY